MLPGETLSLDKIQSQNPYVGPRPFREDEQHRFFGRTEEIVILEGLTLARRETLLFAQSGAGKSRNSAMHWMPRAWAGRSRRSWVRIRSKRV